MKNGDGSEAKAQERATAEQWALTIESDLAPDVWNYLTLECPTTFDLGLHAARDRQAITRVAGKLSPATIYNSGPATERREAEAAKLAQLQKEQSEAAAAANPSSKAERGGRKAARETA